MSALIRYVWVDTLRSQRWVAPLIVFAAVDAIISAQTGTALSSYAVGAAALLFVSTWLTVTIVNNEDAIQQDITEVCAGSASKVRLSKLAVSLLMALTLGILGMIAPTVISSGGASLKDFAAGVCAQFLTALTGVAFGAFCSRPILPRRSWSVSLGVLLGMATVLVPHAPPTRQLLVLFDETGRVSLAPPVLAILLETLLFCLVAVTVSLRIAQRRA